MTWKSRNLRELAGLICGNSQPDTPCYFRYRSSRYLTEFFEDCDLDVTHDGSTRSAWVAERPEEVLAQPCPGPAAPPEAFVRIVRALLDKSEARDGDPDRAKALATLNVILAREGWEAFYDQWGIAQLCHKPTGAIAQMANPHRPMTPAESERRAQLTAHLDTCSEDALIEDVLLPLFRQPGFHRITAAGHRDKALEYGKDVWMTYTLPTLHVLYVGVQAKRGKLDSAGIGKDGSANVAEVFNQAAMMLGHEVFDPALNRRVLVDHVFIIAGGQITKQARNWIGSKLDTSKRSQIIFMDRDDILNLFIVTGLPLPKDALPPARQPDPFDDDIPF